jgi:hypothetical protein
VEFCAHYTQESNGPADQNMQWSWEISNLSVNQFWKRL